MKEIQGKHSVPPVLKPLGFVITTATTKEEQQQEIEDSTTEEVPHLRTPIVNMILVYNRLLILLLLLIKLELPHMGIQMNKNKTRRPSWRWISHVSVPNKMWPRYF
jgi:hypothetical protein